MKRTRSIAVLILTVLCGFLLTPQPASYAAQGDPLWSPPISLSASYGPTVGVKVHGDGTVSTTTCGGDARFDTFDPSGTLISQVTNQQGGSGASGLCGKYGAVGTDGTLFYSGSSSGHAVIHVMKNGASLNTHTFSKWCSGSGTVYAQVTGSKIGADGNFYATITYSGSCSQPDRLISIEGRTGALRFNEALPGTAVSWSATEKAIGVYAGGVIIVQDLPDNNADQLLYYDYNGTRNEILSCALTGSTDPCGFSQVTYIGETIHSLHVNLDGTVFVSSSRYQGSSSSCPTVVRTLRYDLAGTASTLASPYSCGRDLRWVDSSETRYYATSSTDFTAVSTTGAALYSVSYASKPGYTVHKQTPLSEAVFDGNGKAVVERIASPTGSTDRFLYVDELQPNGTSVTLFSTEQFATNGTDIYDYKAGLGDTNIGFGKDVMYVAYCVGTCSTTTTGSVVKLQKVDSPGINAEYPRGEIFGEYFTDNGEPLNYVALGDSFSSGEGVPAFIAGTDTSGPPENRCHRSTLAYPMLLDKTSGSEDMNLRSFRACSGATSVTVESGQWNGSSQGGNQLTSVTTDTDVITLTVGGNNVGFRAFATACISGILGCDMNDQAYATIMSNINSSTFASELDTLYNSIAAKLTGNSSARVLVVGYPYVAEPKNGPGGTNCSIFDDSFSETEGEEAAIRSVIDQLNSVIEAEVAEMGSQFEYVSATSTGSPFNGHGLCTEDSYFSYIEYGIGMNTEYWFHPTDEGQAAYASLIESALNS